MEKPSRKLLFLLGLVRARTIVLWHIATVLVIYLFWCVLEQYGISKVYTPIWYMFLYALAFPHIGMGWWFVFNPKQQCDFLVSLKDIPQSDLCTAPSGADESINMSLSTLQEEPYTKLEKQALMDAAESLRWNRQKQHDKNKEHISSEDK